MNTNQIKYLIGICTLGQGSTLNFKNSLVLGIGITYPILTVDFSDFGGIFREMKTASNTFNLSKKSFASKFGFRLKTLMSEKSSDPHGIK